MTNTDQTPDATDDQPDKTVPVSRMRRLLSRIMWVAISTLVLLAIATWLTYYSAQSEPDFYHQALAVGEQNAARQGDVFEKQLLDLQNAARSKEAWQASFSEDQVNGWLAHDFPEKFPNTLPRNVSDPRVQIMEEGLSVAFRFQSKRLKGVVNAEIDAFCTEVPGQIAIRVKKVRSGFIPIPVNSIADRVTEMMRRLGIQVTWTEVERDPTALLDLRPDQVKLGDKYIVIDSIQLLDKEAVVSGKSNPMESRK